MDVFEAVRTLLAVRRYAEAPLAIAVAVEHTRFAVSDASRAIQSMMLTA